MKTFHGPRPKTSGANDREAGMFKMPTPAVKSVPHVKPPSMPKAAPVTKKGK